MSGPGDTPISSGGFAPERKGEWPWPDDESNSAHTAGENSGQTGQPGPPLQNPREDYAGMGQV